MVLDSAGNDSLHGRKPQEKVVDGQDRSRGQKTEECVHDALTNNTRTVLQVNQKTELNQEDRCRCGSGKAFLECHGLYLCNYLCGFAGDMICPSLLLHGIALTRALRNLHCQYKVQNQRAGELTGCLKKYELTHVIRRV